MKKILIYFSLLFLLPISGLLAASQDAGYTVAFLKMPVDARAASMGGAYIAVSDDGTGLLHNPAGVQSATKISLTSSYRVMNLDRKLGFISLLFPTKEESALAFSWLYAGYGSVEERDASSYATGEIISSNEHVFGVTFAKRFLPSLGLGAKFNYFQRNHANLKSSSIGINVGATLYIDSLLRYGTMEGKLITDITGGFAATNIFATGKYKWETEGAGLTASQDDAFPQVYGLGASCRAFKRRLLVAFDAEWWLSKLQERDDSGQTVDRGWKSVDVPVRFGAEYKVTDMLLLRTGMNQGIITAGAGFRFNLQNLALSIDYAFSNDRVGEGDDHIITLDVSF